MQWSPPQYSQAGLAEAPAALEDGAVLQRLVRMGPDGPVRGDMSRQGRAWKWGISRHAHSSRLRCEEGGGVVSDGEDFSEGGVSEGEGECEVARWASEEFNMDQFLDRLDRGDGYMDREDTRDAIHDQPINHLHAMRSGLD